MNEYQPTIKSDIIISDVVKIDVDRYSNLRDINKEIMEQLTAAFYSQIVN